MVAENPYLCKKIVSMKILIWWLCTFSFLNNNFTPAHTGTLKVIIENVKVQNGKIMLALYNTEKDFLSSKTIRALHHPVVNEGTTTILLSGLDHGIYAISLYHDENNNGKLDTNFFKIPKEPYGFSNDARGVFGPPKYSEASFIFEKEEQELVISLK